MTWNVFLKKSAIKELEDLPDEVLVRVDKKISGLSDNPFPASSIKLKGSEARRIRIGNYRLVYTVDSTRHEVEIIAIRHRKEVYKKGGMK